MKKSIQITVFSLIAFLLFMMSIPFSVSAEDGASDATVSISSTSGKAGDTVTVTVDLKNNPGVVAMDLDVSFDNKQLELVDVSDSGILKGGTINKNNIDSGKNSFKLVWEDGLNPNNNASGTIATMTFKLKEDCDKASVSVSGQGYDYDINAVKVKGQSGTITNTNPTTTTTTTKATTTKPTTTKANTTKSTTTTTKRSVTTVAYTYSYNQDNTYPMDFEVTTEESTTEDVLDIIESTEEMTTTEVTVEETSQLEEETKESLPRTKLILIVLMVCFAIVGVAVIISMVRKSQQ